MKLWVVEVWDKDINEWVPTYTVGNSRREARSNRTWDWDTADERTRIKLYTRAE